MKRSIISFISNILFLISVSFLLVGCFEFLLKINQNNSVYTNANIIIINSLCWLFQTGIILISFCKNDYYKIKDSLLTILFFTLVSFLTCSIWYLNTKNSLSIYIMVSYILNDIFTLIFFGSLNFMLSESNNDEVDEEIVIDEDDLDDDFIEEVDI